MMKTKIVYVLSSTLDDFFWEQCLISVISVRHQMPKAHIVLVCDNKTYKTLEGIRVQILDLVTEIKTINFCDDVSKVERSRLMKVNSRNYIEGTFLYIDCDTLVVDNLNEIDDTSYSIAAVLDGHCELKANPMQSYFAKQNLHLSYDFTQATKYFSGGVIFAKDDEIAHRLYKHWIKNYNQSVKVGTMLDEPALCKSNLELDGIINEMDGTWNCQIRFGAMFLANAKILHFCSKKNMPVNVLATKAYLNKVKRYGKNTPDLIRYISNWKESMPKFMVVNLGEDAIFNLSKEYENKRMEFIHTSVAANIYIQRVKNLKHVYTKIRNNIVGRVSPKVLSQILYKECFGNRIHIQGEPDFNHMVHKLAFYSDTSKWSALADKIEVREYIKDKGLLHILTDVYGIWKSADKIDFSELPNRFVIKCNHDNGSTIIVPDKYSVNIDYIRNYFKSQLKRKFGIETAEPHYRNIQSVVFAEEFINNDKHFSDSIVSYKFFSFYGEAEFCQIIYDSKFHRNQKSNIYKTESWSRCDGHILRKEGKMDIPRPTSLSYMLKIVNTLSSQFPFCRIDLYEYNNRIYFSEMTFMPGCGRNTNFSKSFLQLLGSKLARIQSI